MSYGISPVESGAGPLANVDSQAAASARSNTPNIALEPTDGKSTRVPSASPPPRSTPAKANPYPVREEAAMKRFQRETDKYFQILNSSTESDLTLAASANAEVQHLQELSDLILDRVKPV